MRAIHHSLRLSGLLGAVLFAAWPIIGACALALLTGQAHGQDHSKSPPPPPAPDSQSKPQEPDAPVPRADRKQMLQPWARFKQANQAN